MRTVLLILVGCSVSSASAQVRLEKAADRRALRVDHRERRDDRRDAARLELLLARWDGARTRGDLQALAAMQGALKLAVARELAEGRWEVVKDVQELGQDRRELRRDVGRPLAAADDRRDLRDDRRDARSEVRDLVRTRAIDAELAPLVGKTDAASLERTRTLLVEVIGMGWTELAKDRQELREDRRELREDRRQP